MWLTGVDAPCLHTMYADKPMRGHGLMQVIAKLLEKYDVVASERSWAFVSARRCGSFVFRTTNEKAGSFTDKSPATPAGVRACRAHAFDLDRAMRLA